MCSEKRKSRYFLPVTVEKTHNKPTTQFHLTSIGLFMLKISCNSKEDQHFKGVFFRDASEPFE